MIDDGMIKLNQYLELIKLSKSQQTPSNPTRKTLQGQFSKSLKPLNSPTMPIMYNGKMIENHEKFKQQLWNMDQKLKREPIQLVGKHILLQGMQERIDQLNKEIHLNKSQNSSKNESIKNYTRNELILENNSIKKAIKDLESDHISFVMEITDAIEELKHQIQIERTHRIHKEKSKTEEDFYAEMLMDKSVYKNRIEELEKQVKESKQRVWKMQHAGKDFQPLDVEDDPAGPNCKCIIC